LGGGGERDMKTVSFYFRKRKWARNGSMALEYSCCNLGSDAGGMI